MRLAPCAILRHRLAPSRGAKRKAQNLKHVKHVARKPVIPRFLAPSRRKLKAQGKAQNLKHVKHVARKAGILSFLAPLPPSGGSCYGQESTKYLCAFVPICHQSGSSFATICIQEIRRKGARAQRHSLPSMPWADLPRGIWAERQLVLFGLGQSVAFLLNAESHFRADQNAADKA